MATSGSSSYTQPNLPIELTQSVEKNGSLQLRVVHISSHSLAQLASSTNSPKLSPNPFPMAALMEKSPPVKFQLNPIAS
jgi:hypothetical protein